MKTYAIDFETYYDDTVSILTLGTIGYLRHPQCDIYMVSVVGDDGTSWVGNPKDFDWTLVHNHRWIFHNASFDMAVIARLRELGVIPEDVQPAMWSCTADLAAYASLPRALKGAIETAFKGAVEVSKDTRNAMKGKQWDSMSEEFRKEVSDYALHDSFCCLKLWEKYHHIWPLEEQLISQHTAMMGWEGLPVNREKIEAGISNLKELIYNATQHIPWAGDSNASILSPKALAAKCREVGIEPPKSLAQDSEECLAWEDKYGDEYPWVSAMRTVRRCNALLKKLETMQRFTKDNGRMAYGMKYFGGHTGRDSGGGGVNCVTGEHEVLTPDGWMRIDEWSKVWKSTPIMQFDTNRVLSFVKAKGCVSRWETSPLWCIKSSGVSLRCTADHRIIYFEKHSETFKVKTAASLPMNGYSGGVDILGIPVCGFQIDPIRKIELSDDDLDCAVLCAISPRSHLNIPKRTILIGTYNEDIVNALQLLSRRTKIPLKQLSFANTDTPSSNYEFGPLPDHIPLTFTDDWLLHLNLAQRDRVISSILKWAPPERKRERILLLRTLDEARSLRTAFVLWGRSSGIRFARARDKFSLTISRPGTAATAMKRVKIANSHGCQVYCPQVPSSFWLVRHNDTIHVTGNCQNLPRTEMFGVNLREMVEAPAGKTFAIVDLAQIEPRILNALAGNEDMLQALRDGYGIYEAGARTLGLWDGKSGTLKKTDPKLYQAAKAVVLGAGYGMSGGKFHLTAPALTGGSYTPTLTEAEHAINLFRQRNPKITRFWETMGRALKLNAGRGTFSIELPSGRELRYFDVKNIGGITAVVPSNGKHLRKKLWFGTIVENVVQATARDVFMHLVLECLKEGFKVVLRVHDEVVIECDEADAQRTLDRVLEIARTPPSWIPDIPLDAEGVISKVYTK